MSIESAETLLHNGQAQEALRALRALIAGGASTPRLFRLFLRALDDAGFYRVARTEADRAIALFPSSAPVLVEAGNAYMKVGRTGDAERAYNLAVEQEPNNSEAIAGLSSAAFKRGRMPEARALLEKAVERLGRNYNLMTELARQIALCGNLSEAERILGECISSDPERVLAPLLLALLYQRAKLWDKATEYASRVLEINSNRREAMFVLANSYLATGKASEGLALLEDFCLYFPFSRQRWRYTWFCLKGFRFGQLIRFYRKWMKSLVAWSQEKVSFDEAINAQRGRNAEG